MVMDRDHGLGVTRAYGYGCIGQFWYVLTVVNRKVFTNSEYSLLVPCC
jgi:hypothetical protein